MLVHAPLEVLVNHAGLHHGQAVGQVDLQHLVHERQFDDHTAVGGDGAAADAGAGAARHVRHAMIPAPHDQARDLLGRRRQHHRQQLGAAKHRGVVAVHGAFGARRENVLRADDGFQIRNGGV